MLHPSPDADADSRRTSVDLQASLSVHFDGSSFDLLKDKISLPEHDSMGDLDMDMGSLTIEAPERGDPGQNVVMPSADAESDTEPDFGCLLEERLSDMKIVDDEVPQSKDGDGMDSISTPPSLFNNYNPSSQFFLFSCPITAPLRTFPFEAPQAPVRQSVRPGKKMQVPAASITSNAPPALLPKRGARASISGLPLPAATTALRVTKKAKPETAPVAVTAPFLGRKTAGGATSSSHATTRSAPLPPPPRAMELGGVQRPPASSVRAQAQSHRNTQTATQAQSKGTAAAAATSSRSSGLRPPTSRASNSGIAVLRRVAGTGGGAVRTSMAVGGGGRLGSSGVARTGLVKGDGASSAARMMRRA